MKKYFLLLFLAGFLLQTLEAQLVLPPSGANQKSVVTQYIGAMAHVTIIYNSPDVTSPQGTDRKGKIWGQLIPYGLTNKGFGLGNPSPWRAGANENTVIEFSHDVKIQGKALKAGTYGFHVIVEKEGPWTIIFSHNSTAWGSYFYKESEDALRVQAEPVSNEYREWLTFEFTDRQPESATVALMWENISLPFKIEVENSQELYLANIRKQLEGTVGFNWANWNSAANYCLQNNINLEEGLQWAEASISTPGIGNENFTTLSTKSAILSKLKRTDEAKKTMNTAIKHPTATVFQIHGYGRQLIAQGEKEQALKIFQLNVERFGDSWPTHVGMARGLSAVGKYKEALKHAKIAVDQAPNKLNKDGMQQAVVKLEKGEDIN